MHVFLLDTEGSGSTEWNTTHDAKIFALVVLLSSLFVYNSMGAIDERAINSLSLAAELSSNIAIWANKKLGQTKEDVLSNFTPNFLWLLRDFVLEMKEDGRNITENEYLENWLDFYNWSNNEKNKWVREALIKFFKRWECMTMVRPVEEETDLVNLNNLSYDDLWDEFKRKADILKYKIFEDCPLKEMNSKPINGKILASLLEQYVDAVNNGAVPNINTAWEGVVEEER